MDPGAEFEERFAETIGAELVPNSGQGRWAKMDARGLEVVWSCKWTGAHSRVLHPSEFAEVVRAVRGPGGYGGDVLPGLAIGIGDFSVVCMEPHFFMDFIQRDAPTVPASRAEARRIHAGSTPLERSES